MRKFLIDLAQAAIFAIVAFGPLATYLAFTWQP